MIIMVIVVRIIPRNSLKTFNFPRTRYKLMSYFHEGYKKNRNDKYQPWYRYTY